MPSHTANWLTALLHHVVRGLALSSSHPLCYLNTLSIEYAFHGHSPLPVGTYAQLFVIQTRNKNWKCCCVYQSRLHAFSAHAIYKCNWFFWFHIFYTDFWLELRLVFLRACKRTPPPPLYFGSCRVGSKNISRCGSFSHLFHALALSVYM